MARLKIAVSQADMKHSRGIIRALARQGCEVHGLSSLEPRYSPVARSRYCTQVHRLAQDTEEAFLAAFLQLQARERFDVLIPVGAPVTTGAARHYPALSKLVKLVCPRAEAVDAAEDKLQMARLAERAGVPHPRTLEVTDRGMLVTAGAAAGFPLIIKGRHEGTTGGHVVRVNTAAELESAFDGFCAKFGFREPARFPILQEFIPGWGCGFFATYQNGIAKRVFMHRRIREFPASGGPSCCAESFFSNELREEGTKILDALHWHGVAMVEFRCDARDGKFKLMEVNPKFWGSLELALDAGADFAGDYVKLARGEVLPFTDEYRPLRRQWVLGGDLFHAIQTPGSRWAIVRDLLRPGTRTDLRPDDPRLLLHLLWRTGKDVMKSVLKRRPPA